MLWQNSPTVVIGRNQNAYAEINTEYTSQKGIKIARRISGGGAVYHDLGNINYTFIGNKNDSGIDFKTFTKPIINALASLGINATLSGRNDIEVNSKKISGNAQHVKGNRVLHHGTLLFNSDLTVLSEALNVDLEKINSKAIKSARSRVTNIINLLDKKISTEEFINLLADFIQNTYKAESIEIEENDRILAISKRNKSREWLYPDTEYISKYSIRRKKRYDFGIVEVLLEMKNETIKNVKIIGDFFGTKDISILEDFLTGLTVEEIADKLDSVSISDYIYGMTNNEFISHIK
jgi:lipoate-protein ligase A